MPPSPQGPSSGTVPPTTRASATIANIITSVAQSASYITQPGIPHASATSRTRSAPPKSTFSYSFGTKHPKPSPALGISMAIAGCAAVLFIFGAVYRFRKKSATRKPREHAAASRPRITPPREPHLEPSPPMTSVEAATPPAPTRLDEENSLPAYDAVKLPDYPGPVDPPLYTPPRITRVQ